MMSLMSDVCTCVSLEAVVMSVLYGFLQHIIGGILIIQSNQVVVGCFVHGYVARSHIARQESIVFCYSLLHTLKENFGCSSLTLLAATVHQFDVRARGMLDWDTDLRRV